MISFENVSVRYSGAGSDALTGVDLVVPPGEFCLVVGPTGSGKTTLLGTATGHVPHFTGGLLRGRVLVGSRDTRTHPPRELADVVGMVGQRPMDGFVTDSVEDELAFVMESLALEPAVMRRRVEETLDLLGLADVRREPLAELSSGQQQRVAIGAAMTAHPQVLVLDEPTSALDPGAAEDVLAALHRLVHDLGVTVLLSEHRLERVVQYADSVLSLTAPGEPVRYGLPGEVLAESRVAPPVVALGKLAGWAPLPVSIRDARRLAPALRQRRGDAAPPVRELPAAAGLTSEPVLRAKGVWQRYRRGPAVLRGVDLDVRAGAVLAIMGRNGAGKTTLLSALQGGLKPERGTVTLDGDPVHTLAARARRRLVSLVPQEPGDLIYLDTVDAECAQADTESDAAPGSTLSLFARLIPGVSAELDPRDLSEGQRLSLVLAIQLAGGPRVVLLDEPTRGLDYAAKDRLTEILSDFARTGTAVVLSSHDVEFVAATADRVAVLSDGEVIADAATAEVVLSSPTYAPQVAKILAPGTWLTVHQVEAALLAGDPLRWGQAGQASRADLLSSPEVLR
ncbi:MAG: ATP-binding cassette domain-containing protein [Actinomycetota bacterium]|nr:ATP-binding cassette domain-containing protein [Actinomycetota bacterium]